MEFKEAMKQALEFEKKGHDIYKEAAEKTNNALVRKTFSYLAEQETNHIREIQEYIDHEHPDIEKIELKGDKLEGAKQFFNTTIKEFREKTELSEDDIKAHEAALELEQSAYDFYKEQHDAANDEKLKTFLKFLMDQENAHFELIQKSLDFIKDPEHFFAEEEGWLLEG
ncbi:ferritin family protein [Candidatus Woesearchaeota archaeon]|jgi:rubrerythrin|nr:ferritin family protein [Candidatus Woesearchaeota archaeon]MBT5271746.1 ferritin family protein [Candidatus Woesearchaeota archaeon]MBT6041575.1 ferritin family protein [Candidatus Woesearchaeota archaeon]MBT6337390.1 ferritin family protein [Candidatus Woesearchaeota archaeon]MBT7927280.1 ferritin family protein [Candidatus Woesearchaeota archaeon]